VEPDYWNAHRALGGFLFARGRIVDATDSYRKVTELRPGSASGFNNLGAALEMQGDLAGAEAAFRSSLQIEPSQSAYSNLGTVHYYQRRFDQAVDEYQHAIALASQDQTLWGNLADAQWQQPDQRTHALDNYRRAIELAERDLAATREDAVTLAQLGHYCQRIGDTARARRYLDAALRAEPASPFVAYYAAVAAATLKDMAEARHQFDAAARNGYPRALLAADPSLHGIAGGS
jgi:Flp pilus assembly protein TadD